MKPKICWVTSSPMTVKAFLLDQLRALSECCDVTLLVNAEQPDELRQLLPRVTVQCIGIERAIRPLQDLAALLALVRIFRRESFALVHSFTPKAGLLAMAAARVAGVPQRLHTFTGQVWATRKGAARLVLKSVDRILAAMTTQPLVDSPSQRDFLVREGVLEAGQGEVLGEGSISGVDIEVFRPDLVARQTVRQELGIPAEALLFLFLGRLNRDKGVLDLADAFKRFQQSGQKGHLLMVGPDEAGLGPAIEAACAEARQQLHFVSYTPVPQRFMAAADVFCLPSYREGFGSVVIEAASCGLPAIGSRIYGITDAIEDGHTGLLHDPGDPAGLSRCLEQMAREPALRERLGREASARARSRFDKKFITAELIRFYQWLGLELSFTPGDLC